MDTLRRRHHSFKETNKMSSQPRRRFSVCFGKRSLSAAGRRTHDLFGLDPSTEAVIDYPETPLMRPPHRPSCPAMNLEKMLPLDREEEDVDSRLRVPAEVMCDSHSLHTGGSPYLYPTDYHHALMRRGGVLVKSNRSSHSSDTSSAYSGSDTMQSVQSSLEDQEVDLTGLIESVVDSDEEEELAETMDSLTVRDTVRECLEKNPCNRSEEDIETLLEFVQHLRAFTNLTMTVRRALCAVMVFVVIEKAGSIVLKDGEVLDSWSVIVNGHVEVELPDGRIQELHLGDSFGITPTMEKVLHQGVIRTKEDDCQFVCIAQSDYYKILHQGEENIRKHEENGKVVLVTEHRSLDGDTRRGYVVIRGSPERLMSKLVEDNSMDSTYIDDFLLTHRTFITNPLSIANNLINWFDDPLLRDKVTRVALLWVNNHFTDFEMDPDMMDFLEKFESKLEREKMHTQQRLLNIACAAKAQSRTITLARSTREEVLHFSILGGYERGFAIFISKVDKCSKAEEVGLKRGDQILEVNGQSFEHLSHAKALEVLRGTTHLCITVRSNLLAFKEMLNTPDNSPRQRGRKTSEIAHLQTDPRARLSSAVEGGECMGLTPIIHPPGSPTVKGSGFGNASCSKKDYKKGSMTLGHKEKLKKALAKMSIIPKSLNSESYLNSSDDSLNSHNSTSSGGSGNYGGRGSSPQRSSGNSVLYHSHSNPDLTSIIGCYDDTRIDFPEHVLKVYRADQTCKYLLVHKETTAREVVMLSLREFGITDPSNSYSLCDVSVGEGGVVKQRRLQDQLQNLAERISLSSRYYLKNNASTEPLVPDDLAVELLRESQVSLLHLNSVELATQLTLEDFNIFRQIEPTEYIDAVFGVQSKYGTPMLSKFEELTNREVFWVVTEICSEHNLIRRMKVIKQFIKVARQCKECKNFNSMFAILGGLGHGAVSRLRLSWEKLPTKYLKLFEDLQDFMDPSRNMCKYRNLLTSEQTKPPMIPFYPLAKKDLTFIHLANRTVVEGLINFEKLRMISKEVHQMMNMCSAPYDLFSMLEMGGAHPTAAMASLNSFATTTNAATVKRRKKSSAQPNPKKMFEEAQMVRRVKAYLANLKVITHEDALHTMSLECEPLIPSGISTAQTRKPHPSPTLSSTSSNSSTSENKKSVSSSSKFGADSPQAVRKLLSLSDQTKTRPHQPSRHPHSLSPSPSPSTARRCQDNRYSHGRSNSDTTNPATLLPVNLSVESSSVTSLNHLPLRKSQTSGSVTSTDSVSGTHPQLMYETDSGLGSASLDSHSTSSAGSSSSPPQRRKTYIVPHSPTMKMRCNGPVISHNVHVLPPIPSQSGNESLEPYSSSVEDVHHHSSSECSETNQRVLSTKEADSCNQSKETVPSGYYSGDGTDPEDEGTELTQVSAV